MELVCPGCKLKHQKTAHPFCPRCGFQTGADAGGPSDPWRIASLCALAYAPVALVLTLSPPVGAPAISRLVFLAVAAVCGYLAWDVLRGPNAVRELLADAAPAFADHRAAPALLLLPAVLGVLATAGFRHKQPPPADIPVATARLSPPAPAAYAPAVPTFHGAGTNYCIPKFPAGWIKQERAPSWDRFVDQQLTRADGSATLTFVTFQPDPGKPVDLERFYGDALAARRAGPGFRLVGEPAAAGARAFHALVTQDGRETEEALWVKTKGDRVFLARLVTTPGAVFAREWEQLSPLLLRFETTCIEDD